MNFEKILHQALQDYFKENDIPKNLKESIEYSLLLPGKRIRPRLTLSSGTLLKNPIETSHFAAIAIEMIHCFTLIHDDLPCMDNDDFRRGKPANHKVYGESIALLAGDALISLAYEQFLKSASYISNSLFHRGFQRLLQTSGASGVIGGQAAEGLLGPDSSLEDLLNLHRKKTGALFEAAVLIPMDFSGIQMDSPQGTALTHFARELGLAFQLVDDIEDASNPKENPHTSVLRFMSAESIKKRVRGGIETRTEELNAAFGHKESAPLIQIASEVLQKVE